MSGFHHDDVSGTDFVARCQARKEVGLAPGTAHIVLTGAPLTEHAPRSISVDRGGYITYWGDGVAGATGFSQDEVLRLAFARDIVTRDVSDLLHQKLCQALAGEPMPPFTLPVYTKDGRPKLFKLQPAADRIDGKIVGATFVLSESGGEEEEEEADTKRAEAKTSEVVSTCVPATSPGGKQDALTSYAQPSQVVPNPCAYPSEDL